MGDPRERADERIERALVEALPTVAGYPRAHGLPELREAIARWVAPPLRRRARSRPRGDPHARAARRRSTRLAQVLLDRERRPHRRRLHRARLPGLRARRAVRRRRGARRCRCARSAGSCRTSAPSTRTTWSRVALLWLNYPNNPTGAVAGLDFLERAAALARRHGFVLACDEPYTELWFEEPPPSALQLADRRNVLVVQLAEQALVADGLPLGLRGRGPGARRRAQDLPPHGRNGAAGVRAARLGRGLGRRGARRADPRGLPRQARRSSSPPSRRPACA